MVLLPTDSGKDYRRVPDRALRDQMLAARDEFAMRCRRKQNDQDDDSEGDSEGDARAMMKTTVRVVITVAALLLGGCSPSQLINTGGATKCKDFITQDQRRQNQEITKMLKDNSGLEPSNLEVTASRLSAFTYCQALGKPDTTISHAPHG